jgi:hypothetical protein
MVLEEKKTHANGHGMLVSGRRVKVASFFTYSPLVSY